MVDVTLAVDVIQAVEQRLATGAVEARDDVVARQARAERQRMRREHRAARLPGLDARQVHGALGVLLELQVRDARIVGTVDARDDVRQQRFVVHLHVMLDDRRLGAGLGNDEVAHVDRRLRREADEHEMDRLFDGDAAAQLHEGAVGGEGRVQRGGAVAVLGGPEVRLGALGCLVEDARERGDFRPGGEPARRRQRRRVAAVDEHRPMAGIALAQRVDDGAQALGRLRLGSGGRGDEILLLERQQRRMPPCIGAGARPAFGDEAIERAPPGFGEPGQRGAGERRRALAECLGPGLRGAHRALSAAGAAPFAGARSIQP